MREVHFLIRQQGCSTKEIILVTTLLDAKTYARTQRRQALSVAVAVVVDLLIVKTSLGMDVLRGKTPPMVRKEIYVHLMVYNLLRTLMWSLCITQGVSPLRKSKARHSSASAPLCPGVDSSGKLTASKTVLHPTAPDCTAACARASRS